MKALKVSLLCGLGGAVLFGVLGLIAGKGDWTAPVAAAIIGLLLGLIAAPEFEPKAFKRAALHQFLCGALAAGLAGAWLTGSLATGAMLALIGGAIGWLAPWWLRHVQGP